MRIALKKCTACGKEYPHHIDFFYRVKDKKMKRGYRWESWCKRCRHESNARYTAKKRHNKPYTAADWALMRRYKPPCLDVNERHCVKIKCKHHMAQFFPLIFERNVPIDKAVDFLLSMPYTCIHDVFRDYPDGMTYPEMGKVFGIAPQAAEKRVVIAMKKLRNRVTPEEIKILLDGE